MNIGGKMTGAELVRRYNAGERDFRYADLRSANLWSADLRHADLENANLWRANLQNADLRHADLRSADLVNANLRGADLRSANLWSADLRHADLRSANLWSAYLWRAYLWRADLGRANLENADLRHANLRSAIYTIPQVLLANWGIVSDNLCTRLMRLDAEALPGGSAAMTAWAAGGMCPLEATDGQYQRVALFREKRELWTPGRPWSLWRIWRTLAAEKGVKISGAEADRLEGKQPLDKTSGGDEPTTDKLKKGGSNDESDS